MVLNCFRKSLKMRGHKGGRAIAPESAMPDEIPKSIRQFPASTVVLELLQRQLPGTSAATRELRQGILSFAFDLTARTAFLAGPIGAGKSTVARMIAFVKRIAPLRKEEAQQLVANLRFSEPGLIDEKVMHWYVEIALTGVVDTLAESQIFGIGKGVATGVGERIGIFELAQRGRDVANESAAVRITGGVVFLDEIAELPAPLQAKLLPVLSGGVFHRVGAESKDLTFRGITLAASWKKITESLRPDLVSRITDRVITVPGLRERGDDIIGIIDRIQIDLIARYQARIHELSLDPAVDRAWVLHARALKPLDSTTVKDVAAVQWDGFGNMRGLTLTLRQMLFGGKDLTEAIRGVERLQDDSDPAILEQLFRRSADGNGLANHVRELENQQRRRLREMLINDTHTAERLLRHLGLDPQKDRYQVQQLGRPRRRSRKVVLNDHDVQRWGSRTPPGGA